MFELKVTKLDGSVVVKHFDELARKSVIAKYSQLISESEIMSWQVTPQGS
jgi:hypothetical protein